MIKCKCNKIIVMMVLAVLVASLGACSAIKPKPTYGTQSANDINQILQSGARRNSQIANGGKGGMPGSIQSTLMPDLSLGASSSDSQDTETRFNVSANNVDVHSFFMSLVKGTKFNMVVSPKVTGTISINLRNVTIDEVLQAVQDNYGYQYNRTAYGYQIFPNGLETRTFTINYLDISRDAESNTNVSSGQITQTRSTSSNFGTSSTALQTNVSPTSTVKTESESKFWSQLQTTLDSMVGTANGHKVIINPDAGIIIIRAFPDEFKVVSKYLDSVQQNMTREVIIEAKILEVQLKTNYQAGIDWTALGLSQLTTDVVSAESLPLISPAVFSLDAHHGSAFAAVVKLLSTQGNVQTLSSPRIATLNNQMAVIKVGSDEFFITDVADTTTGSGTTAQNTQDVTLTPFFSGIALDVTPQIAANGDVIIHIHPVISTVEDQTKTFTVSGQQQSLPLALSKIRESDSIVRAKNGQLIVIGGLMENNATEERGSTPFLDKTPVIGALFKRTDQNSKKTELVILLRPTVVGDNTWTNSMKQAAQGFKKVDRAFNLGSQPQIFGSKGHKQW